MGRPKLTDEQKAANKARREQIKNLKPDTTEDILAKIANAQSQAPSNILPVEGDNDVLPKNNPVVDVGVIAPEPGENDPDYEAKMIAKIEAAMANAHAQTMNSLKPTQIKVTPLGMNTSEVQIITNKEIGFEDAETEDTRPEFVKADD